MFKKTYLKTAYNSAVDKKVEKMIKKAKEDLWRDEQKATMTNPRMICSWRKPISLLDEVRQRKVDEYNN